MAKSAIEWTESTWNPVTGCTKISPGCKHCYAERMAERLQAMGQANYRNGFELTLQPHMLELPLRWKKPQTIFVNSMSDLFHKDVPLEYIRACLRRHAPGALAPLPGAHEARRAARELSAKLEWAPNVWMGVSVESERLQVAHRRPARDGRGYQVPLAGAAARPAVTTSTCEASTGSSSAASPARRRDRWNPPGSPTSATSASGPACRSSSSSGAARTRSRPGRVLEGRTWDEMPADPAVPTDRPRRRDVSLAVVPS